MQFKIKNTVYEIKFTFFALILFLLTTHKSDNLIYFFIFAVLHEIVHLVFIYIFSVPPQKVSFSLFGANIKRGDTTALNTIHEIIINISAPVFNIITGAFFHFIPHISPEYAGLLSEIGDINLILGGFNLIPFYTFDGGNGLKYILVYFLNEKTTEQALTCISLIVTVIFSFGSIYIFLNYQHNFSLLLICIYMFLSIIFKKQNS